MPASETLMENARQYAAPYRSAVVSTPHDTTEELFVSRGIHVGTAGNATLLMADGTTCIFTGLTVGDHPYAIRRVNSTALTAANIILLR